MRKRYDTPYSPLSDGALYARFRTESWKGLNAEERLDLLQELENREAARQNRPAFRVMQAEPGTGPRTLGYFNGKVLCVNKRFLGGRVEPFARSNYTPSNAIDTIVHEGRHAFQRMAAFGVIKAPQITAEQKKAWLISFLAYQSAENEANGDAAFALYAFQPIERDAREFAAREMKRIYRIMVRDGGVDAGFERGIDSRKMHKEAEFDDARKHLTPETVRRVEERIADQLRALAAQCPGLKKDLRQMGIDLQAGNHGLFRQVIARLNKPGAKADFMDGLDDMQLDDLSDLPEAEETLQEMDEKLEKTLDQLIAHFLDSRIERPHRNGDTWIDRADRG